MAEVIVASPDGAPVKNDQIYEPHISENPGFRQKCQEVLSILKTNLTESEFKVIGYVAACSRGLIKPFPLHLTSETDEGFEALNALNRRILKLGLLRHYLENDKRFIIEEPIIELLHWLLCGLQRTSRLEVVTGSSQVFSTILSLVNDSVDLAVPTECFKLKFWSRSAENLQWEELRAGSANSKATGFAFLRTQVDQLHALIHFGVAPFLTTDKDLESGVELTTDLEECIKSTHSHWVWGKNSIGLQVKVVTIVEFLQDYAKAIKHEGGRPSGIKYFVCSKAVRARFILLYNQSSPKLSPPPLIAKNSSYRFRDHFIYHLPCVIAYLSVGFVMVKQTQFWHNLSLNGARSAFGALCNRLSW